jgi:hypothetical protein
MDLLCNDIKLIVHRYLFDERYTRVKEEYAQYWLGGLDTSHNYWDDKRCFFKVRSNEVGDANWRNLTYGYRYAARAGFSIHRFSTLKYIYKRNYTGGVIPNNY